LLCLEGDSPLGKSTTATTCQMNSSSSNSLLTPLTVKEACTPKIQASSSSASLEASRIARVPSPSSNSHLKLRPTEGIKVDPTPPKKANRRESMSRSQSAPGLNAEQIAPPSKKSKADDVTKRADGSRRQTVCPAELRLMLGEKFASLGEVKSTARTRRKTFCTAEIREALSDGMDSSVRKQKTKMRIKMKASELGLSSSDSNLEVVQQALEHWMSMKNHHAEAERLVDQQPRRRRGRSRGTKSFNRNERNAGTEKSIGGSELVEGMHHYPSKSGSTRKGDGKKGNRRRSSTTSRSHSSRDIRESDGKVEDRGEGKRSKIEASSE
jgi:hypothetical protein